MFPVVIAAEMRKGCRKCGIIPAPGNPGCVMHQPQAAKGFNETQPGILKIAELAVSFEQQIALAAAFIVIGCEHPDILYGRPVQKNHRNRSRKRPSRPQQIAGMAVAV
jgi:hypothetical protein